MEELRTFKQWAHSNKNVAYKAKNGTAGKAKYYTDWERYYPTRIKDGSSQREAI
jgi:hypothetical protein